MFVEAGLFAEVQELFGLIWALPLDSEDSRRLPPYVQACVYNIYIYTYLYTHFIWTCAGKNVMYCMAM